MKGESNSYIQIYIVLYKRIQIQSLMDNRYKSQGNPPIHWLLYKVALLTQGMKKKPTTGNTALSETVIFTQQTHMKTHFLFIEQLNKIDPYHWPFPMSVFKPESPMEQSDSSLHPLQVHPKHPLFRSTALTPESWKLERTAHSIL